MTRSDLVFALVVGIVLILLVILSRQLSRGGKATPIVTKSPRTKRDPKPFAGLTRKLDVATRPQGRGGSGSYPSA